MTIDTLIYWICSVGDSNAGKAIILDNIVLPAIVDALRLLYGDDMPDAETLG